jgi:hypothetical protein
MVSLKIRRTGDTEHKRGNAMAADEPVPIPDSAAMRDARIRDLELAVETLRGDRDAIKAELAALKAEREEEALGELDEDLF